MANGIPSSLRQISTTASASRAGPARSRDTTLWARSRKRFTAADSVPELTSSDGTRPQLFVADPQSFAAGRQNRYGRRGGQDRLDQIRDTVNNVLAVVEHQQPDTCPPTRRRHCRATVLPGCWVMPSTAATASGTAAGSATAASSKNQTPSGNSSARAAPRLPLPDGSCRPRPPRSTSPADVPLVRLAPRRPRTRAR